jgi:phosphoserine phosphatase RsbU/P
VTQGGMAIGAIEGVVYGQAMTHVAPGDSLLLLSDGTFEVGDEGAPLLDVDRLAAFAATDDDPETLHAWVRGFSGNGPLPDDFSLLRLRF